jgi:hypothetical protein
MHPAATSCAVCQFACKLWVCLQSLLHGMLLQAATLMFTALCHHQCALTTQHSLILALGVEGAAPEALLAAMFHPIQLCAAVREHPRAHLMGALRDELARRGPHTSSCSHRRWVVGPCYLLLLVLLMLVLLLVVLVPTGVGWHWQLLLRNGRQPRAHPCA